MGNFRTSDHSAENVLRDIHDATTQSIRTTAQATIIAPGGIEVNINHQDDSIALGDGVNLLTSTTVGAKVGLDVSIINAPAITGRVSAYPEEKGDTLNVYGDVSVIPGVWTILASYTVPAGKQSYFTRTEYSGDSLGTYEVRVNALAIDKKRTNYTDYNASTILNSSGNSGIPISAGTTVDVRILQTQTSNIDFNARIEIIEVDL